MPVNPGEPVACTWSELGSIAAEAGECGCDQTGATEVDVSFAVGLPDRPLGLVVATEDRPLGPAAVVDVWGDALIALAWQSLLDVASGVSAASGSDSAGTPLIASALHSDGKSLSVTPQARFAFDASGPGPR